MKCLTACIALVLLTACRDGAHPKELVGSWVSDRQMGGDVMRVLDSLELRADGTGASHRQIYSFNPSLRDDGSIDTLVTDKGRSAVSWEVVNNEDGRHLCLADADGADKECGQLEVVPETELSWGEFTYRAGR